MKQRSITPMGQVGQLRQLRQKAGPIMLAALSITLLACSSSGSGSGALAPGDTPVSFSWISEDGGNSGTMSATFADGRAFNGLFLQQSSSEGAAALDPNAGDGWRRGWGELGDWGDWGPYPQSAFTTLYSGRASADLRGPAAQRLQCRFQLDDAVAGLRGGGHGECRSDDGHTVQARFPRG